MKKLEMQPLSTDSFRLAEAYKVVRSNLMFMGSEVKAIVFTSGIAGEGKSTVSWNIANSLAESGKSVVYIDADMRKSVFMAKHRVKGNPQGLSHFLSDQAVLNDVIYATDTPNLYILPAGPVPPNPAELLSKHVFADAIKVLKGTFDYIIVDAPPITATTDPAIIASVCDGSVMVIGAKKTSAKMIRECIDQLKRTGKPVLGSVLNMVDYKYFSYGYEKYYGKYYGYGSYYGHRPKKKTKDAENEVTPVQTEESEQQESATKRRTDMSAYFAPDALEQAEKAGKENEAED